MTQFVDMSDDDISLMMQQSHEFMSLLRVIAANSLGYVNQCSENPVPNDLQRAAEAEILEGNSDTVFVMKAIIPGFVALLKRHKGVAELFEFCAKVPPEQNLVKKSRDQHEARETLKKKKLEEMGVEFIEVPGVGTMISMDANTPKKSIHEILGMIIGDKRRI